MRVLIVSNKHYIEVIRRTVFGYDNVECKMEGSPLPNPDEYDVGISYMYTKKITPAHLINPWINFHPGPLPEYKGRNLCYHAIMEGEAEFGASVHYMDENFDTGPIIEVARFPIYRWDTAQSLHDRTMEVCLALFRYYFMLIITGNLPKDTIKNEGGVYYEKEPISDWIYLDREIKTRIRAITFDMHKPLIEIGGKVYKVIEA